LTIAVKGTNALVADFDTNSLTGVLSITSGKIFGNLKESLGTITVKSTTLGVSSDVLSNELNQFFNTNVASLNTILAAGFAIPSFMGISFSDGQIVFNQGYLELGLTIAEATKEFIM